MRCSQKRSSSENIAVVLVSRCISTRWSLCWNQWDAIRFRCNQVPPGAIRCNQVPPGVIRCHQVKSGAIRCNQVPSGSGAIRFRCNQVSLQSGATRCIQVQCTWNALTLHCTSLKIPTFSFFPTDQICHQAFQEIFRPSSWYLIPLIRWEISLTKREGKINSLKKLFDSSEGLTWHRSWSQKGFHEL